MDVESVKSRTQLLAQVGAALAVVLYAVGFSIVSVHHGFFGISQFSLLRPKIVSAGILFFVFLGLPVLEAARVYGFWGLGYPGADQFDEATRTAPYLPLMRGFSFLVVTVAISIILRPFLQEYQPNIRVLYWSAAAVGPGTAALYFIRKRGRRNPVAASLLMLLAIALVFISIWRIKDPALAILVAWFCASGLVAHYLNDVITAPGKLRQLNWHIWLTNAAGVVIGFAIFVYPLVPPAFGGGAPLPATIQFTEKGPLGDTQEIGAWLIDETDMGFYILRAKDAKKAMFIPRRYVRAIYFGNEILQESNGHDPRNDGR